MSDWPVGLSTGCFYQRSIFDCLESIRSAGFGMIEICSFPAHLDYHDRDAVRRAAKRIDDLGIEPYSFHAPFADHIDISSLDHRRREASLEEILRAAETAASLQVRYFVIHPGPEQTVAAPGPEHIERMEHAANILDRVVSRCRELGIGCVLENKLPHLLFGSTNDLLWIMGAMEVIDIGLCLDTGHASLSGDLYHVMHKTAGHLQMIHANDNNGHHDDHLPPGEGVIQWPRLLTELRETGFHGGIILELAGNRDPQLILSEARTARRYLRDLSRRLTLSRPPSVGAPDRMKGR